MTETTEVQPAELDELEALVEPEHEPDYDPEAEAKAAEDEQAADDALRAESQASAQIAVSMVASTIEMVAPAANIPDQQREKVAAKLEAVIYKYGGVLPPWLAAYREELEFAGVLAITGFGVYMQVKAAKAAEAKQQEAANGQKPEPIAA